MASINQWTGNLQKDVVTEASEIFAAYDAGMNYVIYNQGGSDLPIRMMMANAKPTKNDSGWLDVLKGSPLLALAESGARLYLMSPAGAEVGISVAE